MNCSGDELEANQSMDDSIIYIGTETVDGAGARPKEESVDDGGLCLLIFFVVFFSCIHSLCVNVNDDKCETK